MLFFKVPFWLFETVKNGSLEKHIIILNSSFHYFLSFIKSFTSTFRISAIWNNTSKLGCRLLQTYALTIQKLLPRFSASHVCLIPRSSSTSFIRFMGLSIVSYLSSVYKGIKYCAIKREKRKETLPLHSNSLKSRSSDINCRQWCCTTIVIKPLKFRI